jgi:hypothetical protein
VFLQTNALDAGLWLEQIRQDVAIGSHRHYLAREGACTWEHFMNLTNEDNRAPRHKVVQPDSTREQIRANDDDDEFEIEIVKEVEIRLDEEDLTSPLPTQPLNHKAFCAVINWLE